MNFTAKMPIEQNFNQTKAFTKLIEVPFDLKAN